MTDKAQYLVLIKHSPKGSRDSKFVAAHPDLEHDTDFYLGTIPPQIEDQDRCTTGYKVWECYYESQMCKWLRRAPRTPNAKEAEAIINGLNPWALPPVEFKALVWCEDTCKGRVCEVLSVPTPLEVGSIKHRLKKFLDTYDVDHASGLWCLAGTMEQEGDECHFSVSVHTVTLSIDELSYCERGKRSERGAPMVHRTVTGTVRTL
jgi:hypothetical protein